MTTTSDVEMVCERLGLSSPIDRTETGDVRVPVFVIWCAPTLAEVLAATDAVVCPACQTLLTLDRPGGVRQVVAETPTCGSISTQCQACRAQLHFDCTPEGRRATLRWLRHAVEEVQ